MASDEARKRLYGSRRTLEIMDEEKMSEVEDDEVLSELDSKMIELKKERQKFFDQRREYNKLISNEARGEHLEDCLVKAATELSKMDILPLKDVITSIGSGDYSDNEAVIVFSDWHYGLKTENIFNKYDTKVCRSRVSTVIGKAIERIELNSCRKLHIFILGDLIHGAIHCGARVASEELVCDQLMQASELLAEAIECLSCCVEEVEVYTTYGNHARTVQNKSDSLHRDNMERIVPWWLSQRFKNEGNIEIHCDEGDEFLFANVCGHGICASHGDNDSVRTASRLIPTLFYKKYGRDIEYILLGDKHHRESFDELGVTSILCSSLCGTDDYANEKRLYSDPSQLLLIVNPELGVDAEYVLKCGNSYGN